MKLEENKPGNNDEEAEAVAASASASSVSASDLGSGEEIIAGKMEETVAVNPSRKEVEKGRKSSPHRSKNNPPGKRSKVKKVDWTPELHKRFVEAVEQLGVDKAVPSRILELMGIDCLTRHNIASHLQKYRSHRKHVLTTAIGASKRDQANPWIVPSIVGFPPVTPTPHFRPLHVWGHPSVDQSLMHTWPKHIVAPPLPPHWPLYQPPHPVPPPPQADPYFWHSHHQYVPTAGAPCYAPHLPPITSFPNPVVPGILPPTTYKVEQYGHCVPAGQALRQSPSDVHPSKERIDAAIGDVLEKPWLPLPLGLKPPSINSVMVELKRQGISKIPPSTCA